MEKLLIGWVIRSRVKRQFHANVRVYGTEATAKRYAGKNGEVLPCYVDMTP